MNLLVSLQISMLFVNGQENSSLYVINVHSDSLRCNAILLAHLLENFLIHQSAFDNAFNHGDLIAFVYKINISIHFKYNIIIE